MLIAWCALVPCAQDRAERLGEDEEDDPVIDEWQTFVSDAVRKFNEQYLSVYVSNKAAVNRCAHLTGGFFWTTHLSWEPCM